MTTKDEALKMAIEALINSLTIQDVAINACQEALEQPKEKKYLYAHSYDGLIVWSETNLNVPDRFTFVGKMRESTKITVKE